MFWKGKSMSTDILSVQLLGDISLEWNERRIYDADNRSRKSWLLLAYLIYNRTRKVSQRELMRVLWESEDKNSNPYNALKTLLHRTRSMVNELEDQLGHRLIIFKNGMYSINPDIEISCDVDRFDSAVSDLRINGSDGSADPLVAALDLYRGDFLSNFSMEQWVIPINVHYHDEFVELALSTADALLNEERYEECRDICLRSLEIEAYDEELYLYLLRSYEALGNDRELKAAYEKLKNILYSTFGTFPSEEASALYRNACNTVNDSSVSFDTVLEQMSEVPHEGKHKAVVCDYDLFKLVYRVGARQIVRSGDVVHVALFTVHGKKDADLAKRSLDKVMDNLEADFGSNLRAGDIIARCSSSQFVIMLPQSNYENSCMVCDRLLTAYHRKYPHSPADIDYEVRGISPNY